MSLRGGFHWNILVYWLILGGYLALDFYRESEQRKERASELEKLLAEPKLSALRAQLNPHFLFNALNTISAYVESEPKLARRMLGHLGDLLRMSLHRAEQQQVTLAEEIDFLEQYLAIQRIRFTDCLKVGIDIDAALLSLRVPNLLLQPLVENAITHGLAEKPGLGEVLITAESLNNGLVRIVVSDNGVGLGAGWQWERHAGIGLTNTRARLLSLHGMQDPLIVRDTGSGVRVEITLPLIRSTSENEVVHAEDTHANR